jgi:hypothetical protein
VTPLSPLGSAVELEMIGSLMTARPPELTEPGPDGDTDLSPLLEASVRGICTEVQPYVGSAKPDDVATAARWDLAVWAVTLGVAAQLEASLFPEQQGLGDAGRAAILGARYREAVARLAGRLPGDAVTDGESDRPSPPRGNFPRPLGYPDPLFGRRNPSVSWAPGGP